MRKSKNTEKDIQANWEGTWKEILENPDGSINKEQLKLELMDFSDMIYRMSTLTCEITQNRMSYSTYAVSDIMGVVEEVREEELENQKEEDKENGVCSFCDQEIPE